ncbi:hypothetical protein L0C21_11550 [Sphingosinicellaceae bacterium A1X5R2]|nr:hypothetical protein [Pedomonas mirosovicensis]MCH8685880.1 hypothetical protein [Pedomonas mirosovicensis]
MQFAHVIQHVQSIFQLDAGAGQLAGEMLNCGWMHNDVGALGEASQFGPQIIPFPAQFLGFGPQRFSVSNATDHKVNQSSVFLVDCLQTTFDPDAALVFLGCLGVALPHVSSGIGMDLRRASQFLGEAVDNQGFYIFGIVGFGGRAAPAAVMGRTSQAVLSRLILAATNHA